ncbi:hypothetical protein KEM09_12635 [Carboxylicivirga mesophila]|uniref:DUF5020 domain-containing protein n=1 Tax=Carboxylicivirga mesophila TaxID=1166478 RepID=A0ABS5KBQ6_9BACT|nr:hypothetical protein [Carboxylicivirga mesophila]MBS2212257.1 hypothetical protein [Carboxylicivirga mesophila]
MSKIFKPIHCAVSIAMLLLQLNHVCAQEKSGKAEVYLGGDLTTRFYWRGMLLSASPAFQPYLELNKGMVTLGAWGSYSFAKEPYQEIDVYLSIEHDNKRLTIYDYFSSIDSLDVSHQYFDWSNTTTTHAVELIAEWWDIMESSFSLEAGVFIYGDDKDESNRSYYSAYFEPQYRFLIQDNQMKVFAGFTPVESLYATKAAFVNVGVTAERQLRINEHIEFPFTLMFAVNPHAESVFMVATVSL